MKRSKAAGRLQDLALVLLTCSALFLLSRLPLLDSGWQGRIQTLLTAAPRDSYHDLAVDLAETMPSVHLVVTDDSEYGRYSQLYAGREVIEQIAPLFQEALGSATVVGAAADKTLQDALSAPSLYLDLTVELPLEVIAAWLGQETDFDRQVRSMALTTEEEGGSILYLRGGDGAIFRYNTALPVSAVRELTGAFAPNGGSFAFESNYSPLAPYTVLVAQPPVVRGVQSGLPAGYSAYDLLTALDFNAHTNARYPESDGTEVIVESPRTLRLAPNGTVTYRCDGEIPAALYHVPAAGEAPTAVEALQAAGNLASALTAGTGASSLHLRSVEPTGDGYRITFGYQADGLPVFFPSDSPGLDVTVAGQAITAFTYHCRSYTATEETAALMPPEMAIAIASLSPGSGLSIGYVDSGAETAARWLPR